MNDRRILDFPRQGPFAFDCLFHDGVNIGTCDTLLTASSPAVVRYIGMGITVLPANTVRAIGSTQCLTDPASVVKELVENSLDAHATAIFVEISSNTIDKIIIRDNGHGIGPEDRRMVCKRYCTSKIRSLRDLHDLGGQSLGFRGEALASAAEMSTRILLTTRVESEATGKQLDYDRAGLVKDEKRVSHTVGTTIEVDHFLSSLPVRKQSAEKSSTKCLSRIKKLLQTYALVRPQLRLSLKVLKAKSEKGNWSYAPKSGATNNATFMCSTLDAAINVFGRKAAEQLQSHSFTWSSAGKIIKHAESELSISRTDMEDVFIFNFFVVCRHIAETAIINNLGQHISIDARPVSCCRGVLKELTSHYKSCLRSAIDCNEDEKVIDPLLILNIGCPKGSYDVNVEPAKDDILFIDADAVLQMAQKSLNSIYGEPDSLSEKRPNLKISPEKNGFDVLLARKTTERVSSLSDKLLTRDGLGSPISDAQVKVSQGTASNSMSTQAEEPSHDFVRVRSHEDMTCLTGGQDEAEFLARRKPAWKASMRAADDDDLQMHITHPASSQFQSETMNEEGDLRDINISNPWAFSKIHAPSRPSMRRIENHESSKTDDHLLTPRRQRDDIAEELEMSSDDHLPPSSTSPIFPYPIKAFGKRQSDDKANSPLEPNIVQSIHGTLDSWLHRSSSNRLDPNLQGDDEIPDDRSEPSSEFVPVRNLPLYGTALHDIPDASQRRRRQEPVRRKQRPGAIDKPFISPVNDPKCVWFKIGEHSRPSRYQNNSSKNRPRSNSINLRSDDNDLETQANVMHPDLAITLDYETRKAKATQDHREYLRREQAAQIARQYAETAKQGTLDSLLGPHATQLMSNSPYKNRQMKAVAALHTYAETPADDSEEVVLPHAGTGKSPSKRWSKGLPLERVKEQDWVSGLILPLSTTQAAIAAEMKKTVDWDDYVYTGESTNGLDGPEAALLKEWEQRFRQLVGTQFRKGDPHVQDGTMLDEDNFVFDLSKVFLTSISGDL